MDWINNRNFEWAINTDCVLEGLNKEQLISSSNPNTFNLKALILKTFSLYCYKPMLMKHHLKIDKQGIHSQDTSLFFVILSELTRNDRKSQIGVPHNERLRRKDTQIKSDQ